MRHRITQGTVNYWPNRFEAAPPASASEGGFQTYPQPVGGVKKRGLSDKFREHHNQAQLFYNSMSLHEKLHMKKAFSFELDHCDDPAVYERMAGHRLSEIDLDLAQTVPKWWVRQCPISNSDKTMARRLGTCPRPTSHLGIPPLPVVVSLSSLAMGTIPLPSRP